MNKDLNCPLITADKLHNIVKTSIVLEFDADHQELLEHVLEV